MTEPALGVMLFSLGGLIRGRTLDLEGCLAGVAALGPDPGIELIGAQSLRGFPRVDDDEIRRFRRAVDRTGVVPVGYCAYLERARSRSRVLSPLEALALVEPEIDLARRLGFPMVRINTATPAVLPALASLSDRSGITLLVELATEPRTDRAVAELVRELDRLACPGLGLIQDFSAFVHAVPQPFVDASIADGTPGAAMGCITAGWAAGRPLPDVVAQLASMPGLTAAGRSAAMQAAHITYALFRAGSPDGLDDVLPHLRHVQAKFFAVGPDGREPCIPYPELIARLRAGGYAGRIHSEFEGFLWSERLDAFEQIAWQQADVRRLWRATDTPDAAPARWQPSLTPR